jgi:hypothetical protein
MDPGGSIFSIEGAFLAMGSWTPIGIFLLSIGLLKGTLDDLRKQVGRLIREDS